MTEYKALMQVKKYLETRMDILKTYRGPMCRDRQRQYVELAKVLAEVNRNIPGAEGYQDEKARKQVESAAMEKSEEYHKKKLAEKRAEKEKIAKEE